MPESARSIAEQDERLRPFPQLPEGVRARYAVGDLALRPFGLYEGDLNVDFERTPRPILVTHLIECCTSDAQRGRVETGLLWHLPVGKRIECLLTMLWSGRGAEIPVPFRCPNSTCEQRSEIEIAVDEVAALQEEAYATDRVEVPLEGKVLALRRPTGSDQLRWLEDNFSDRGAALRAMVRTLLLTAPEGVEVDEGTLVDEWLVNIEVAMEENDPLVNFTLRVKCPACESETPVAIDLEELSLRGLRQAQSRLLASVHRLAAHYHWSEQQIFTVPYWRRLHYLSLIEGERQL
jgi:hypothetical protein